MGISHKSERDPNPKFLHCQPVLLSQHHSEPPAEVTADARLNPAATAGICSCAPSPARGPAELITELCPSANISLKDLCNLAKPQDAPPKLLCSNNQNSPFDCIKRTAEGISSSHWARKSEAPAARRGSLWFPHQDVGQPKPPGCAQHHFRACVTCQAQPTATFQAIPFAR